MAAEVRRIVVGLLGPQMLELRVSDDSYQALRKAIEDDNSKRWHVIPTQESEVLVDLSKVVYLSLASQDHRVGF
jgi:hypothetical protein